MTILYEDDVVDAVCAFLTSSGWRIDRRAHAHQRGDDIVASRADQRLVVEAKGAGSSKEGTKRYGKSFNRGQVKTHVGMAVLRALGVAGEGTALAAIALPDDAVHRDVAGRAAPALAKAEVGIFWVSTDLGVRHELPWERQH